VVENQNYSHNLGGDGFILLGSQHDRLIHIKSNGPINWLSLETLTP